MPWLWLSRVFGWDGVLPLFVLALPAAVSKAVPNADDAICVLAVAVPIAALLLRYLIGWRAIAANAVGHALRTTQQVVFSASILLLVLIESFVVLLHLAPAVPAGDLAAVGAAYAVYFAGMTFAMYPGRRAPTGAEPEPDREDAVG